MDTMVLTVSSKGQISIPVSVRKKLSINEGDKLVAYVSGDAIMLKVVRLPSIDEFEGLLKETQQWAKTNSLTEDDISNIIKDVRNK